MRLLLILILISVPFSLMAQERIGLYSGTFDPIHKGHYQVLLNALDNGEIDKIIIYPNLDPSHKTPNLTFSERWDLVSLAVEDNEKIVLPGKEKLKSILSADNPNGALFDWAKNEFKSAKTFHRVMGADSFQKFLKISPAVQELDANKNMHLMVMERDGYDIIIPKHLLDDVDIIESPAFKGYSSSKFRANPSKNKEMLPEKVWQEVKSKNFYEVNQPETKNSKLLKKILNGNCNLN